MRNGFKGQVYPNYINNFALQVQMLKKGGAIPPDLTDSQAMLILMRAAEMQISQVVALNEIRIKEGKTVVSFELFRFLTHRSGLLSYEERFDNSNESLVRLMHINGRVEQATFSVQEAKKMNLLTKESWQQNKIERLYERAYLKAVRRLFPEVCLGIIIEDEYVKAPNLLQKIWNFLINFRKAKKVSTRIIKASFSQIQQHSSNASNVGVAKILAKKAVELSKEQPKAVKTTKVS